MDNRYYDNVIAEMQGFLDENGFKAKENGFANEQCEIEIKYDEAAQTYALLFSQMDEDGSFGEKNAINTWLFDDSQNAKDAGSVGIDFVASLRKALGIKSVARSANVELPTATKSGNMTVTGFTKKMLDVFPAIKEDYKEHIAVYGNFLYINFFGEKLVPLLINLFENGTKKQIKKLYDVFEDVYVKGDKDTVNIMIAVLSAAAYNNEKVNTAIEIMLKDNGHFLQAYQNLAVQFPKSKKLFSALVK